MSETTTTPVDSSDVGDAIVLDEDTASQPNTPDEQAPAAEVTPEETHTDPDGTDESDGAPAAPDTTDKHSWLRNKGIDPSDPDALDKVEEKWRQAEDGFHASRDNRSKSMQQELAEDEQIPDMTPDTGDADNDRVIQLERDMKEIRFFSDPEHQAMQQEMIEAAREYPHLAQAFDLDSLFWIAKGRKAEEQVKAAKSQGRTEAKADMARQSAAAAPSGMASGPSAPADKDIFAEGFDQG